MQSYPPSCATCTPANAEKSILFWIYQGTPNIDNNRITEKRCMMDYFILVINKDEHITSSEFALNYDGARSDCGMKVDLYSLCGKLTRAASDYYHSNKELFEFFSVSVNTIIQSHPRAAKFHCELCRFPFAPNL